MLHTKPPHLHPPFSLPEEDPSESESQEVCVPGVGAGSAPPQSPGKSHCLWAAVEALTCLPPRRREAVRAEAGSTPSTSPPRQYRATRGPLMHRQGRTWRSGHPPTCSPDQGRAEGAGNPPGRASVLAQSRASEVSYHCGGPGSYSCAGPQHATDLRQSFRSHMQTRLAKNPHSSDPCTRIWLDEAEPRELGSAHPDF